MKELFFHLNLNNKIFDFLAYNFFVFNLEYNIVLIYRKQ